MSDCYRLEWTHFMKTIQTGIGESLERGMFRDTMVICRDGMMMHNKLTLGLLLPELAVVPEFSLPVDHTVLLPDYRLAELQRSVAEMFLAMEPSPSADIVKEEFVAGGMSSKPEACSDCPASDETLPTTGVHYSAKNLKVLKPMFEIGGVWLEPMQ